MKRREKGVQKEVKKRSKRVKIWLFRPPKCPKSDFGGPENPQFQPETPKRGSKNPESNTWPFYHELVTDLRNTLLILTGISKIRVLFKVILFGLKSESGNLAKNMANLDPILVPKTQISRIGLRNLTQILGTYFMKLLGLKVQHIRYMFLLRKQAQKHPKSDLKFTPSFSTFAEKVCSSKHDPFYMLFRAKTGSPKMTKKGGILHFLKRRSFGLKLTPKPLKNGF